MADKRTIRDFTYSGDVLDTVAQWAAQSGYQAQVSESDHHLYQKGSGFWVAPQRLDVSRNGDQVHLEAWIRAGWFVRLMSFFILPAEIHIGSGGMKAALPRKMARKDINALLETLGQPRID